MADVDTVLRQLASDPQVWQNIQSEVAKASDRNARLVELANEQGYTLRPADLDAALARARSELDDTELDRVAGGFNPQPEPPAAMNIGLPTNQILIGLLLPAVQKVR